MFQDQKVIFRFNGLLGVPVEIGQTLVLLLLLFAPSRRLHLAMMKGQIG